MASRYNKNLRAIFYLIVDMFVILAALITAYIIRFEDISIYTDTEYWRFMKIAVFIWVLSELILKTWQEHQGWKFFHHMLLLIKTHLLYAFLLFITIFFLKADYISRTFLFIFLGLNIILTLCIHYVKYVILSWYRRKGRNIKSVLVIGPLPKSENGGSWNLLDPSYGYRISAIIDAEINDNNYLEILEKYLLEEKYDEILITKPSWMGNSLESIIEFSEDLGLRIKVVPSFMESYSNRVQIDYLNGTPVINVRTEPLQYWHNRVFKRLFDLTISLVFIVTIYWWVHLLIGLAIKLTSRGPVFFKQKRIGVNNRSFICYKFRTMAADPENSQRESGFGNITKKNDSRITKVGKFLRCSNLDELPQFLNVLKGDMSIVGPRPHMVQEDQDIQDHVRKYRVRRFVKPGITGWAQINGFRGGTKDLKLMQKRIEHDIYYIEKWSTVFDLKIIGKTAWQMLTFNTQAH